MSTGNAVKTGISGRTLNQNQTSPRANVQVNRLNRAARVDRYEAVVVQTNMPGRQAGLDWERGNADRLRNLGQLDPNIHSRP